MDRRLGLRLNFDKVKNQKPEIETLQATPGLLHFSPECSCQVKASDLEEQAIIGTGNFASVVVRMVHKQTQNVMAVKKIRANDINEDERRKMQRELKIIIQSKNCEDIVRFYGVLFVDANAWIVMEVLDCSLDQFYKLVYNKEQKLPEEVIGFIAASVVRALNYLKSELNIIHRDVKPSNILLDGSGFVKLCDFGISGYLVDSIAKSQDVGCIAYISPERLSERKSYDIRSDVWSLGISLVEISIGKFPYAGWKTIFDQLQSVVNGDPPFMTTGTYSVDMIDFVNNCLIKDYNYRPKFTELMTHVFFKTYDFKRTCCNG
ncbi:Kinase [Aphelenchoides besseyi]|nr:Kinase [Aphelenchoides besseyi]